MPPKNAAPAKSPELAEQEATPADEEAPGEQDEGDFVFPDGSEYRGQYYKKGTRIVMHGQGRLQSGSDLFEGSFEQGLYKNGRYESGRGGVYSGFFRKGLYHGPGEYTWPNDRKYNGMWRDGAMHGWGEFENFSIGVDKVFKGVCVSGQFKSGLEEQAAAQKAFLAEYERGYIDSVITWLKGLAEQAQPAEEDPKAKGKKTEAEPEFPPEILKEIIVPPEQSPDSSSELDASAFAALVAERTAVEQLVSGPFPEATALKLTAFHAFVGLFADGAETPGQAAVLESTGAAPLGDRLRRAQLEHIGQAVRLFAPDGMETGALNELVFVNTSTEYDSSLARWRLVHLQEVPSATGE